jgi:hypothetical protein
MMVHSTSLNHRSSWSSMARSPSTHFGTAGAGKRSAPSARFAWSAYGLWSSGRLYWLLVCWTVRQAFGALAYQVSAMPPDLVVLIQATHVHAASVQINATIRYTVKLTMPVFSIPPQPFPVASSPRPAYHAAHGPPQPRHSGGDDPHRPGVRAAWADGSRLLRWAGKPRPGIGLPYPLRRQDVGPASQRNGIDTADGFYRRTSSWIEIVQVLHGSRDLPRFFTLSTFQTVVLGLLAAG